MMKYTATETVERDMHARLDSFDENLINFRLWAKDKTLFSNSNEDLFLDWLDEPRRLAKSLASLYSIRDELSAHNFTSVVLLGMGGSSLSPMVFRALFAPDISFHILDTIHPSAIARLLVKLDLSSTLFIVASKSGTTLEPMLLYRFFVDKLIAAKVRDPYAHFMAITDPVTVLEQEASENGFLRGPFGEPGIGGRFSGLSVFGLMPALLMGINVEDLLSRAINMAHDCGPSIPARDNPAAVLAAFFAACYSHGRDKIVFHLSPSFSTLGLWLEQLLAESLGKSSQGLVPLIGHHDDIDTNSTMHIYVNLSHETPECTSNEVPRLFIEAKDNYDVAGIMFLFQMSTALFAAVIKINPFDQPDVEKSKRSTKAILDSLKPGENPLKKISSSQFADNARTFFKSFERDDYVAILAFIDENQHNLQLLTKLKLCIEEKTSLPVMLEFGPRYLHSVGQLFKGGKNNGHFLVVSGTYDDGEDFQSSENNLLFSQIHLGQALGDIDALSTSGRSHLHVHVDEPDFEFLMQYLEE